MMKYSLGDATEIERASDLDTLTPLMFFNSYWPITEHGIFIGLWYVKENGARVLIKLTIYPNIFCHLLNKV